MNKKELIKLLDKYEIEYEITDNTKEVEEGLRLLDEALEKIGIIISKETQINNITRENDPEVPKYTTEWTNSSDLVFRQATIPPVIHSKHTETHECDCISRRDALKPFCITSDGTRIPEVDCDNFPVEFSVKDIKRHLLSLPPVEPKRPKTTETMMVDGEPMEIDPLSYEVGYTHGQFTERPKGEWIIATGVAPPEFTGRYVCSNCGNYALMNMPYGNRQELSPFCPNCGAKMKGGTENE